VVTYSLRLGREYGLSSEEMKALEFGSLLHDIGKIGVPDSILRKPAKLTEEEWVRMREHPLARTTDSAWHRVSAGRVACVAQHHEKWDGTGYPLGLRNEEIDICARIFSVADAFDAITSDRVYRRGKPYEAASQELDDWAGRQFDPKVVEAFHRVPKEDWEELHRQSLMPKPDQFDVRQVMQMMEAASKPRFSHKIATKAQKAQKAHKRGFQLSDFFFVPFCVFCAFCGLVWKWHYVAATGLEADADAA
jgi:hypothetical protein